MLLLLIPFVPAVGLWIVGIGIGFFLIFGFAAWSSVPGRVAGIAHEHIGTAIGLMLTLAAVGGFVVPIIFGAIVPGLGFTGGWIFLAVVTAVFALIALAGRQRALGTDATPVASAPDTDAAEGTPAH